MHRMKQLFVISDRNKNAAEQEEKRILSLHLRRKMENLHIFSTSA